MVQTSNKSVSRRRSLVSIQVITYNQAGFIREALDSVIGQDYENIEIVVADDGSTDGTADIIRDYAARYPDKIVPLIGGTNLGITGNCNRALKACKGKYIAFMGGDDVLLPGKISAQTQWMEASPRRALCGHQIEVFYEDRRPPHPFQKRLMTGSGPQWSIRHGVLFGAVSVMVRADCIPRHGFDSELSTVSDTLFFVETLMGGGQFGFVPGVYARYRRHEGNITNQWERCIDEVERYYRILIRRYPQYRRDALIGEANIILYARGLRRLNAGDASGAIGLLVAGIKRNPLGWKLWVRLIQATMKRFKQMVMKGWRPVAS